MKIKRTHVLVCLNPKFPNFYEIWFYDYLEICGIKIQHSQCEISLIMDKSYFQ